MPYKDPSYWHANGKFTKESPTELLATIVSSDSHYLRHLSIRAERCLKTLDESLAFFIELLQYIYKDTSWRKNSQMRASVAMANGALNYHLLARHAALLGYGFEAHMLHRGCFERMSRALVFQVDVSFAERFWKAQEISQSEINGTISRYFESKNTLVSFNKIYQTYKKTWSDLSTLSHPNLQTVWARTLTLKGRTLKESLGIDVCLGGMPDENVISGIIAAIMQANFSIQMMSILNAEFFGKWNKKLETKIARIIGAGLEVPLTELERQLDILERLPARRT